MVGIRSRGRNHLQQARYTQKNALHTQRKSRCRHMNPAFLWRWIFLVVCDTRNIQGQFVSGRGADLSIKNSSARYPQPVSSPCAEAITSSDNFMHSKEFDGHNVFSLSHQRSRKIVWVTVALFSPDRSVMCQRTVQVPTGYGVHSDPFGIIQLRLVKRISLHVKFSFLTRNSFPAYI